MLLLVFTATQRISFKLYTARVSGGQGNSVLVTYFEGSNNNSNIQTTISVGKSGSSGTSGSGTSGSSG
jgi:hypothetical protein